MTGVMTTNAKQLLLIRAMLNKDAHFKLFSLIGIFELSKTESDLAGALKFNSRNQKKFQ